MHIVLAGCTRADAHSCLSRLAPGLIIEADLRSSDGGCTVGTHAAQNQAVLDNKYYTAHIPLTVSDIDTISVTSDASTIPQSPATLVLAHSLHDAVYAMSRYQTSEICLVTTPDVQDPDTWDAVALEHGFEFVDITSHGGPERLVDALSTYMWPNLVMKNSITSQTSQTNASTSTHDSTDDFGDLVSANPTESIDNLVSEMLHFKATAEGMDTERRRAFAGQIGEKLAGFLDIDEL